MVGALVNSRSCGRAAVWVAVAWLVPVDSAPGAANGFPPDQGFVVRTWGTEAGLPQNTVSAIVQTREGYLWLATREGLARFDGIRFTVFSAREGLKSVAVQSLLEDRHGVLWIGTDGGGLSRLAGGRIESLPLPQLGLGGESVIALAEDAQGRLWVGTRAGLVVGDGQSFVTPESLVELKESPIYALLQSRDGAVWIATAAQGLYEFRDGRLRHLENPPGIERFTAYCLLEDRQRRLWASIGNGTILCRQDERWRVFTQAEGVPYAYVSCMTEEADGTIWTGSVDEGLHFLRGDRFQAVTNGTGQLFKAIRSLCFDREGNLWVGTRTSGLGRLNHPNVITVGPAQGLTNDFTRAVAETADGTLWVGTTGGGLYYGKPDALQPFGSGVMRFYSVVESVLATSDGSLWWGGSRSLLQWKNGELAGCHTNQSWILTALITALCEDRQGGLWIGNSLGSLVHYDGSRFEEFTGGVARGPVTALAQQADGVLWVGSLAGGLNWIRRGSDTIHPVTNGLPSAAIRTLHLEPDGTLWIGTAGGGLSRWREGRAFNFTSQHGLGADTVSQIVEDDDGHLWLGGSRGILRVNKRELNELVSGERAFVHPRAFGLSDGMPVEECSSGFHPAGLKLRSGLLCFSTVRGLVFVNPKAQEAGKAPPITLIESVVADGGMLRSEANDDSHSSDPPQMSVRIPPGRRTVEINYTGLSFAAPEKVRFRYQLQPLDETWVEVGGRRTAYYSPLPPGKFTFRVMACNADAVWSEEATLGIVVKPFLWQTGWFMGLSVIGSIGVFAGLLRFVERRRYRRRLAQLETRHAIERERLRISQDMHDHIGGMLTQVSQLSDLGQSESEGSLLAKSRFDRIGTQARGAVQALDEIVWATNPRNDNLASFTEYVSRCSDEFFEGTNVRCWQEVPANLPTLPLRAELRHNVFLAMREAFNNVLKHSKATTVWLRLALTESEVTLEVEDDGYGFDPGTVAARGNGLGNVKSRLQDCGGGAEIVSSAGRGTKVRLRFPRPAAEPTDD